MQLAEPMACVVDVASGALGNRTGRYEKRLRDLDGLYGDADAFARLRAERGDDVVYAVEDFRPAGQEGNMIFGVTRMAPGRVGDEFFLTRGHIHAKADRPEIYYGQGGHGLMLMESPEGETRIVEIGPQTICYVPPYWIHRSVNTGDEPFVMVFSYPADAGQDYGIIERSGGMRTRIVAVGSGGWQAVENPAYRPRSAAEIAGLTRCTA